jgi:hypothetical protein
MLGPTPKYDCNGYSHPILEQKIIFSLIFKIIYKLEEILDLELSITLSIMKIYQNSPMSWIFSATKTSLAHNLVTSII